MPHSPLLAQIQVDVVPGDGADVGGHAHGHDEGERDEQDGENDDVQPLVEAPDAGVIAILVFLVQSICRLMQFVHLLLRQLQLHLDRLSDLLASFDRP